LYLYQFGLRCQLPGQGDLALLFSLLTADFGNGLGSGTHLSFGHGRCLSHFSLNLCM